MAEDGRTDGLRVLIVEDEALVAMLVEDMLDELGHRVAGSAARMAAALELAETAEVDLAILDVNLGDGKSYPIAAVLARRGVPFIFATGYGQAGLEPPFEDRPTVQKPYRFEDLEDAITAALAG